MRHPHRALAGILLCLAACEPSAEEAARLASGDAATAMAVAEHYVDAYYHAFPEEAYEVGYPDTPMDALGDRSPEAMERWRAREDAWLDSLKALDEETLLETGAWVPWAFAKDRLEASVARRVCRTELWNVSPTWTGWQSMLASTFAQQPVATEVERSRALARLREVSRYLDTEVANLRNGMASGYLAPAPGVESVLAQVDAMLASPVEDSPFYDPAARSDDADFQGDVARIVADEIAPAIRRYRDFLAGEYQGRDAVGVSANPDGEACYRASVLHWVSLPMGGQEIHDLGLAQMERIQDEMLQIAREHFGTDDVPALLERLRTDTAYTFASEEAVLDYARAAVARGRDAVDGWFGFVPDAEVVVRPFPAYQQASGGGFYSAGAADGSRPGTYELGTYNPRVISRAGMEATAFHETYPGHHLQMSVALTGGEVHPVLRYFYVSGMAEGWGLYTERLADEMGLYSGPVDRLGMLSNEALRAARLVVDPGMHVLGWSRDRAIQYMLDHTAESRAAVTSEVDRYLAVPGQATSYLVGSLEIRRLREHARTGLGDAFDVRSFHDQVLADGAVTLPMLGRNIERWMEQTREDTP